MAGYLFGEEGPLNGIVVPFEEGNEWILGRDPDIAGVVLEDPMVSRKHVIVRLTPEGYVLENLSAVNPATQNGKVITEPVLMREDDILQIGNTFFRFSEKGPAKAKEIESNASADDLSLAPFMAGEESRWLLKVIAGPNAGAEFNLQPSSTYIIGKDASLCDIVFQDLSVSRQHARLSVDSHENLFIEDLGSRNGVLVNGELITDKAPLSTQDLIALGTTSFLIIDRNEARETIISPPTMRPETRAVRPAEEEEAPVSAGIGPMRNWRELVIPKRHLITAAAFGVALLVAVVAMLSLFKGEPIVVKMHDETKDIKSAIHAYPGVQFTYNAGNGKLFLVGHVLTPVEKQELLYTITNLPYIQGVEDNIVVDEYVWQNTNALLMINPEWQGVAIYSPTPGRFVVRGYVQTLEQLQVLSDYLNINFPYLDRLESEVVVESNLLTQIQSMLVEKGFNSTAFQLSNGEVVLSGRVDATSSSKFKDVVKAIGELRGIRTVKNFVVYTTTDTSRIDLSANYRVTGYSKRDDTSFFVVINGRILSIGDILDTMQITGIETNSVLLEKDGLKFKINYNLQ